MDDLTYFIRTFIAKNRQDRWLNLANGKVEKLHRRLGELEKHINERCVLVQNNAAEIFHQTIAEERITSGSYISQGGMRPLSPITLSDIHDDSLLICRDKKMAFFFHNEGWIWVCREDRSHANGNGLHG